MKLNRKVYLLLVMVMILGSCDSVPDLGIFQGNGDIGIVCYAGPVIFDPSDSS